MKSLKQQRIDQLVIGFALFSMFFGAGNIIFPPYLGMGSGNLWGLGFLCYYLADIGIAILAIFALIRNGGEISTITTRIGKVPGEIMLSAIILCIGPFIALPRTGATVQEMFTEPVFGDVSLWLTSGIFFLLVLLLTIRESSVVDIIGKILTPALVLGLLTLIVAGVISPLGEISDDHMMDNVVVAGINSGYQTMDVLAAMIFGIIIVKSVMNKGYTVTHVKYKVVRNASLVAAIALLVIYFGLTYLGATVSGTYNLRINRSELLVNITSGLLGHAGVIILGIIVALVSASADYFSTLSKGRLNYKLLAAAICLFSAFVANFGLDKIVALAAPILSLVYPGALTLIILSLFRERVSNAVFKGAFFGSLLGSLLEILYGYGLPLGFVTKMPLYSIGCGWLLWAVAFGLVGAVAGRRRK